MRVFGRRHRNRPGSRGRLVAGYVVGGVGALLLRIATVFLYVLISMRRTQVIIYFRATA